MMTAFVYFATAVTFGVLVITNCVNQKKLPIESTRLVLFGYINLCDGVIFPV